MTITTSQLAMMRHAVDGDGEQSWRNYYCVEIGTAEEREWADLAECGLAVVGRVINECRDVYYHLTEDGRDLLLSCKHEVRSIVRDTPSEERKP